MVNFPRPNNYIFINCIPVYYICLSQVWQHDFKGGLLVQFLQVTSHRVRHLIINLGPAYASCIWSYWTYDNNMTNIFFLSALQPHRLLWQGVALKHPHILTLSSSGGVSATPSATIRAVNQCVIQPQMKGFMENVHRDHLQVSTRYSCLEDWCKEVTIKRALWPLGSHLRF